MTEYGGYPRTNPYGSAGSAADGFHDGIDIGCPSGTPLFVPFDCRVDSSNDGIYGWRYDVVELDGPRRFRWAHLSKRVFASGAYIKAGSLAAYSGGVPGTPGAGNSTGAHLHLELRVSGQLVNPESQPRLIEAVFSEGIECLKDDIRDLLETELGTVFRRVGTRLRADAGAMQASAARTILRNIGDAFYETGDQTITEGQE